MKFCVFGLGAIGGFVAARLALSGQPVSALARGATLAAVRERGLRLLSQTREQSVRIEVSDSPADLAGADVVVLAVKTTALPVVARTIAPMLGPDTVVLSAMNGVPWWFFHGLGERWANTRLAATDPDGELARAIAPERVLGCVVHMAASCPQPGVVRHAFGDRFIIGELGGASTPRLAAVAAALSAAGLQVEVDPRIELAVWLKLWGNMTMNPLSAVTGVTMDRILDDPQLYRFVCSAMTEAAVIGEHFGLPITMTPDERNVVTRKLGAVKTSMLQDVEAGRPIELDALVGSVAEMARLAGVAAPSIDALLGLARVFAQGRGLYGAA
ncbi:MAG: 2-dehydropantoate 2-reductase [Burkholderiaceae bacterium]|nr:2-dehydropantoate 2-reductase [Burkholderiaceae bacterium]